jgi:hypothetical protein
VLPCLRRGAEFSVRGTFGGRSFSGWDLRAGQGTCGTCTTASSSQKCAQPSANHDDEGTVASWDLYLRSPPVLSKVGGNFPSVSPATSDQEDQLSRLVPCEFAESMPQVRYNSCIRTTTARKGAHNLATTCRTGLMGRVRPAVVLSDLRITTAPFCALP